MNQIKKTGIPEIGPLELLIFQGTPFCNIDCSYCYLPDRLDTRKMDLDIIDCAVHKLVKEKIIRDDFTVLWHAGEPLVLPVDYYEKAVRIIRRAVPKRYATKFSFQTNATLINDHWCTFFKKYDVELGVSVDGPAFIHDRSRVTRSGQGTFLKVMRGIETMQRHGLRLNIISVVTDYSCQFPEAMFEFYRDIGANSVSFNMEEVEGQNTSSSFSDSPTAQSSVRRFLEAVFELNLLQDEPFQIREFDWASESLATGELGSRDLFFTQMTGPFKTITINTEGDFSTFSPELISQRSALYGDFVLGNVWQDSFMQALSTKKFRHIFRDLVKGLKKCMRNCAYYGLCPGGIPSSRISEKQTLDTDETQYCRLSLQAPLDAVLELAGEPEPDAIGKP